MKTQLINMMISNLDENDERLKNEFALDRHIKVARHFALDNFLPTEIAMSIYNSFPQPRQMRLLNSYGELKLKYSHIKNTSSILQNLHAAIQDPRVIAKIEEITGIKNQVSDTSRLSGGISTLLKGHYINPHLDNSHDVERKLYRTVNLLYYVSPDWRLENGGNYELWDETVNNRIIVPNYFNRLVVMETRRTSWHAVNPVLCNEPRCCVFNYYFSEQSPEGEEYFHDTHPLLSLFHNSLIKYRPEQKIRRAIFNAKSTLLRKFFRFNNIVFRQIRK